MQVSRLKRFLAFWVDTFIVGVLSFIPVVVVVAVFLRPHIKDGYIDVTLGMYTSISMRMLVTFYVVGWLYYCVLESTSRMATWGKRVFNLKVVSKKGGKLGFAKSSVRYLVRSISCLLLFGPAIVFFTRSRRSLHDIITSTSVVNEEYKKPKR